MSDGGSFTQNLKQARNQATAAYQKVYAEIKRITYWLGMTIIVISTIVIIGLDINRAIQRVRESPPPPTHDRVERIDPRVEERRRAEALRLQEEAEQRREEEAERQRIAKDLELFAQEWVFRRVDSAGNILPVHMRFDVNREILTIQYSHTEERGVVSVTHTCQQTKGFEQYWDCRWRTTLPGYAVVRGTASIKREDDRWFSGTLHDPFKGVVSFYIAKGEEDIPQQ